MVITCVQKNEEVRPKPKSEDEPDFIVSTFTGCHVNLGKLKSSSLLIFMTHLAGTKPFNATPSNYVTERQSQAKCVINTQVPIT